MVTEQPHVMHALGMVMGEARGVVLNDPAVVLRPSQLRVIDMVPREGITVSDLAGRVGMTKQGIGQFVGQLVDEGYLTVEVHDEDRRVRVVRRTQLGRQAVEELARLLSGLEGRWAELLGPETYGTFRTTLNELAELLVAEGGSATSARS